MHTRIYIRRYIYLSSNDEELTRRSTLTRVVARIFARLYIAGEQRLNEREREKESARSASRRVSARLEHVPESKVNPGDERIIDPVVAEPAGVCSVHAGTRRDAQRRASRALLSVALPNPDSRPYPRAPPSSTGQSFLLDGIHLCRGIERGETLGRILVEREKERETQRERRTGKEGDRRERERERTEEER